MDQQKKVVCFGDVMMRLSPPSHQRFLQATSLEVHYGGSEGNVAVALAHLGTPAECVTRFPDNEFGRAAVAHFRAHDVNTKHIVLGGERLGIYFLEQGAAHRSSKVIYDRFDSAFAKLDPSMFPWDEILSQSSWFHWSGITPALSKSAAEACRDAIRTAKKLGIKISGDINYRRNLWQYGKQARDVMPELIADSDVIVGGLTDFENCLGITTDDYQNACQQIQERFPSVKMIATTVRNTIQSSHQTLSACLWNGRLFRTKEYELNEVVDRIGAGDAFMAGLIHGILKKMNDHDCIEFALAACVFKHTIAGDVSNASVHEIQSLMNGENVGKLLR